MKEEKHRQRYNTPSPKATIICTRCDRKDVPNKTDSIFPSGELSNVRVGCPLRHLPPLTLPKMLQEEVSSSFANRRPCSCDVLRKANSLSGLQLFSFHLLCASRRVEREGRMEVAKRQTSASRFGATNVRKLMANAWKMRGYSWFRLSFISDEKTVISLEVDALMRMND